MKETEQETGNNSKVVTVTYNNDSITNTKEAGYIYTQNMTIMMGNS